MNFAWRCFTTSALCAVVCCLGIMACDPGDSNDPGEVDAGEASGTLEPTSGVSSEEPSAAAEPASEPTGSPTGAAPAAEPATEPTAEPTAEPSTAEPEGDVVIDGVPAPGSICPIPDPWGTAKGENLKNMAFTSCADEPVTMWDPACGAAVSWVYFTYGW